MIKTCSVGLLLCALECRKLLHVPYLIDYQLINKVCLFSIQDLTGVSLVNGLIADGTIYCKIHIQPVTYNEDEKFDLNNERFFLLLAAGSKLAGKVMYNF